MSRRPRPRFGGKCAVCYVDPVTGRQGTNETTDICDACEMDPANQDWRSAHEDEMPSADVDVAVDIADGDRVRIEALFGGKRRGDSELARRVAEIAASKQRVVRRRRRNTKGHPLRGWVEVVEGASLRDIANEAGCSAEYVRQVLRRILK